MSKLETLGVACDLLLPLLSTVKCAHSKLLTYCLVAVREFAIEM